MAAPRRVDRGLQTSALRPRRIGSALLPCGRRSAALLSRSRPRLCYGVSVQPHPFRQPAERPTAPPEDQRLGQLRAVHGQRRHAALFHVARGALLLMFTSIIGSVIAGWQGFFLSLPFGIAGFAVLAAAALRHRGLRIELYERGLVVARREGREAVVFDDVDEVWFDLDRSSTPFGVRDVSTTMRPRPRSGSALPTAYTAFTTMLRSAISSWLA